MMAILLQSSLYAENKKSTELNEITIVTLDYPPYTYTNDANEIVGLAATKVQALFKQADIPFKIKILPWKRAVTMQTDLDDVLIYPLTRITAREGLYNWIVPLYSITLNIYALSENVDPNVDILAGKYKFICTKDSANCKVLEDYGVPKSSIMTNSGLSVGALIKLVERKRVDFLITTDDEFEYNLLKLGLNPDLFIKLNDYQTQYKEYLASKIDTDSKLISRIQKAHQSLLKSR